LFDQFENVLVEFADGSFTAGGLSVAGRGDGQQQQDCRKNPSEAGAG
jgi:hypothetical protein